MIISLGERRLETRGDYWIAPDATVIGSVILENNASISIFLQSVEFFRLGLDYDRRLPELLNAVTIEEVNAAAASVLDPSRACAVVAGPAATSGGA